VTALPPEGTRETPPTGSPYPAGGRFPQWEGVFRSLAVKGLNTALGSMRKLRTRGVNSQKFEHCNG